LSLSEAAATAATAPAPAREAEASVEAEVEASVEAESLCLVSDYEGSCCKHSARIFDNKHDDEFHLLWYSYSSSTFYTSGKWDGDQISCLKNIIASIAI